jgi:hypothetical protein
VRDDAPTGDLVREPEDGIARAAEFESTRLLQVLALEKKFSPRHTIERRARHHRRSMYDTRDATSRALYGFEIGRMFERRVAHVGGAE